MYTGALFLSFFLFLMLSSKMTVPVSVRLFDSCFLHTPFTTRPRFSFIVMLRLFRLICAKRRSLMNVRFAVYGRSLVFRVPLFRLTSFFRPSFTLIHHIYSLCSYCTLLVFMIYTKVTYDTRKLRLFFTPFTSSFIPFHSLAVPPPLPPSNTGRVLSDKNILTNI